MTNTSKPLVNAKGLSHSFDYKLFENIDITINPKESIAVLGVSGSGKSTLLHNCSTLLKPDNGVVELFGEDIYKLSTKEQLRIRRDDIGIIFQQHYLFRGFSAKENLDVSALLAKEKIDEELLEKLGLTKVFEQNIGDLSGGQQQRVSIARVLTKKPKIIFADEPTGNLDSKTADEVMSLFLEYVKENDAGLFIVTHDEHLAKECDRVFRLEDGALSEI